MTTAFSSSLCSPCKYEHETVIVENEYPHANITLSSNHFPHNDIDRHDDYVTPKSSPRQPQQPATPQKTISVNTAQSPASSIITSNSMGQSPVGGMTPTSPSAQNKQKHPNNLPYDPFIHTNNKPPLSFSSLIFLAIEDAKEKALPVKEIYSWIVQHYPYFKTAPTGWKNSVRHNLSLNKCFQKVEKAPVSFNLFASFLAAEIFQVFFLLSFTEYGQGIVMASRTAIQAEFDHCLDTFIVSSEYNSHGKGYCFLEKYSAVARKSSIKGIISTSTISIFTLLTSSLFTFIQIDKRTSC